jgi:hypothetical protein
VLATNGTPSMAEAARRIGCALTAMPSATAYRRQRPDNASAYARNAPGGEIAGSSISNRSRHHGNVELPSNGEANMRQSQIAAVIERDILRDDAGKQSNSVQCFACGRGMTYRGRRFCAGERCRRWFDAGNPGHAQDWLRPKIDYHGIAGWKVIAGPRRRDRLGLLQAATRCVRAPQGIKGAEQGCALDRAEQDSQLHGEGEWSRLLAAKCGVTLAWFHVRRLRPAL